MVELCDVYIRCIINVIFIIVVFYFWFKFLLFIFFLSIDIDCVKEFGVFRDFKVIFEYKVLKFNGYLVKVVDVIYDMSGLCCKYGYVDNSGICGEWIS